MSIRDSARSGFDWVAQRDLARRGFLGEMGSFASNLGFRGAELGGSTRQSAILMNRLYQGTDTFGVNAKWMGANQVYGNMQEAMAGAGIKPTAFNKFRFATGTAGYSAGASLNAGFTLLSSGAAYFNSRSQGNGRISSLGAAGMDVGKNLLLQRVLSMSLTNGPALAGAALVFGAYAAGKYTLNSIEAGNRYRQASNISELNGNVSASMHTAPAATMRQRALASINNSQFNSMRALGNEGGFMHSPRARYGDRSMSARPRPILGY